MSSRFWWVAMVVWSALAISPRVHAQDPDVRSLTPVVMLVLDTSGSMEGVPSGVKGTCPAGSCPGNPDSNLCTDCFPSCGGPSGTDERNRWSLAVEALSGTFTNFSCTSLDRDDPMFTYDFGYVAPHHALPPPVINCTIPFGTECNVGILGALGLGICLPLLNTCQGGSNQNDDGVLDAYLNDVRFGLMTFDTVGTYTGAVQLIPDYEFSDSRSVDVDGMFSYGGAQDFTYPNCINTYRMDTGVRRPVADADGCGPTLPSEPPFEGSLISAGSDSCNWQAINAQIQTSLRTIRPYGGTPIAASLRDLDFYFRNHPDMTTDAYSACRGRYGVLITDGKPDSDFRQFGCDQPGFQCPYRLPEDEAGILRCGPGDPSCGGGGNGSISKLFVIGLDVSDPATQADLDLIAQRGGNTLDPATGHYAVFTNDPVWGAQPDGQVLRQALSEILDATQAFPISRTTPITVRSRTNRSYRITGAFERPGGGLPWNGLLERQELGCGTNPDAPVATTDRFHQTLNSNSNRVLFSVLPMTGTPNDTMVRGSSTDRCGVTGCNLSNFDSSCAFCSGTAITNVPTLTADATEFGQLANWMHGRPGSGRETIKLGAVYHSTPVFVDAVKNEVSDASLAIQARTGPMHDRPDVLYVGTNEGLLHAFQLESATGGGEELWGFIPPLLLDKLKAAKASPQIMLDGSPVAKNMFLSRVAGVDATGGEYRTVLASGMRQGGRGYFALDVTDPAAPSFLWQIAEPSMGFTYGRPALAQMTVNATNLSAVGGSLPTSELSPPVKQRAIAILPGGTGVEVAGACNSARDGATPFTTFLDSSGASSVVTHRPQHKCWTPQGRQLYFVDVKSGHIIHSAFGPSKFPSPLIGTPAVFNGNEGAIATRAFISDADGVIWRIDFADPDPANWTAYPFHDMAWGLAPDQGQPGFEPPVLSIDKQGRVVVIYAQGNLDNFENPTAINRVVSLTEVETNPTNPTPLTTKAGFNWEHNLEPSELVTGPPILFEGVVMYSTFRPVTGGASANACDEGQGALYAVDFVAPRATPNVGTPPTPAPLTVPIGTDFNLRLDTGTDSPGLVGKLVMGLSVVQKPSCQTVSTISSVSPAGFNTPPTVSSGPPVFEIVGNTASGGDQASTSDIGQIRRQFTMVPRARVISWAGPSD